MKAWVIAGLIIILTTVMGFFYYMYSTTAEPLEKRGEQAVNIAKSETNLVEVTEVNFYHGSRSFQVVEGRDSNGDDMYVWIEELTEEQMLENSPPQIETRYTHEGVTKEEVEEIINTRLDVKQLKSIRLGMIGNTPVYEVTYVDQSDRHSFYYVTFENGTYINRHYQF